jgi:glycosyltransferase involved in cell wall biosynthesis
VSDDYYNKLITLLDEVKGLKYVVFKSLKQEQIWAITKQASLSLMVPKSDGTPNTALEAMSCKTPLIMGDLNYNQELFGGVALIANLNSAKDLADKIQTALTNYPQAFLERGLHNVSKFGNRSIEMEKLNSLYKML